MPIRFFFLSVIALASFDSIAQHSLCGVYKSIRPNLSENVGLYFQGVTGVVVGSEVILYPDSTFQYTTCGNILKGNWNFDDKTLYLTTTSNKYRIDSLNYNPEWSSLLGLNTNSFRLKRRKLYSIFKSNDGSKTIELLKKSE
jgi:hypothetical protein